ncbi:MAG: DUF4388 domain-containing protein, partial [Candidatus Electryonea clarkiae]|nr:DUF4388 domain-containing protein [Candidatus Electryonea clarkiae]
IEKPFNMPELVETIEEVLSGSGPGFGGMIEKIKIADIIQLIALSQRTVALNVLVKQLRGVLYFERGEIVHAVCGELVGEDAFYEIFNWKGGQFSLAAHSPDGIQSITMSWQGLLMDAIQRQDELELMKSTEEAETVTEEEIETEDELALKEKELFQEIGIAAANEEEQEDKAEDTEFSFDSLEPGEPAQPIESDGDAAEIEIEAEPAESEEISDEEPVDIESILAELENTSDEEPTDIVPEELIAEIPVPDVQEAQEQQDAPEDTPLPEESDFIELPTETTIEEGSIDEDIFAERTVEPVDIQEQEQAPPPVESPEQVPVETDAIEEKIDTNVILSEEAFGSILSSAVEYFMNRWPEGAKTLHFGLLIHLENNVEFVRKHLQFHLEHLVSLTVNTNVEAFDFTDENIADAVEDLKNTLADRWKVSQKDYKEILINAVGFELAHSIMPDHAVAQLLIEHSSGNPAIIKKRYQRLLDCEIIDNYYDGLSEKLNEIDSEEISISELEKIVDSVLSDRTELERFKFAKTSIERILKISGLGKRKPSQSINMHTVVNLLKSSGLERFSDFIHSSQRTGDILLSLDDLDFAMERFAKSAAD